jgi:hypothetical protein
MKPIREQFIDALGYRGKTLAHYRDFTLAFLAGLSVLFGEIFAMEFRSGRSTFDLKVAIGCFAFAVICVLLTTRRLLASLCAVMVPAVLLGRRAFRTSETTKFYLLHIAAAFLVLLIGMLARFLWHRLRLDRPR